MKSTVRELKDIWVQVPPDYYERGIASNLFQKAWHNRKWRLIERILNNSYKNILDVGCASGWLTARLVKIFPKAKVIGLDVSSLMIDYGKKIYPEIEFVCADAHQLPFPDGSFDLIVCTETLEHVVNPLNVLSEIKRCLSSNGEAIISMDSGTLLFKIVWALWKKVKGRVWNDAHLHKFNKKKLENLIKKAGFKIEDELDSHWGMAVTFKLKPQL